MKGQIADKLNTEERCELKDEDFGIPETREFPMPDAPHVRAAEAYFRYAPEDKKDDKLKCLIFDSYFDSYRGVVILVRVMSGTLTKKTKIRMMSSGISYDVVSLGYHTPFEKK